MSALTKVFVVLLVVMSLLLTSGLVVFVNKVEDFNKAAKVAQADRDRERVLRQASDAEVVAVRSERDRAIEQASGSALALRSALDAAQTEVARLNGEVQTANAAKATSDAEKATMGLALTAAQDTVKAAQATIDELRKVGDDLQKKYTEAQVANSDLINKLDTVNALYRKSREDIVALNDELDKVRGMLAGGGGGGGARPAAAPGTPSGRGPAPFNPVNPTPNNIPDVSTGAVAGATPNIRGVVRNRRNIGGVEYATISVGSADNVARGMQFKVLDRNRTTFLGYLTVDSVQANEATGHLQGPRVDAVAPGSEVITNWQ